MKRSILLLLGLLCSSAQAGEWFSGAGIGYQYGSGVGGVQLGKQFDNTKYYAAVSFASVALGVQQALDDKMQHTLGVTTGIRSYSFDENYAIVHYNYYFNAMNEQGWVVGPWYGQKNTFKSGSYNYESTYGLSLGYQF